MIPVKLAPGVRQDLELLPSEDARRAAFGWMSRLRREPRLGQPLDWRRGADLRSCRKIYFEEDDQPLELNFIRKRRREGGPRFRIVYRLLPSEDQPTRVYVLAVGEKRGGVYPRAGERRPDE